MNGEQEGFPLERPDVTEDMKRTLKGIASDSEVHIAAVIASRLLAVSWQNRGPDMDSGLLAVCATTAWALLQAVRRARPPR